MCCVHHVVGCPDWWWGSSATREGGGPNTCRWWFIPESMQAVKFVFCP
jgi:hypothetical protein